MRADQRSYSRMEPWPNRSDLHAYRSLPPAPRAVVLLLHGFAEHAGRHALTAHELARRGIAVYAYDQRGHGRSPGRRALVTRFSEWVADAGRMRRQVAVHHPKVPLFLVGASMGGLMAIRSVQSDPDGIAGVVLISPALEIGNSAPPAVRAAGSLLSSVAPLLPVAALELAALARDPSVGEAFAADPLTHHGKIPARTGAEMLGAARAAIAAAAAWRLPAYIVAGDADRIAAPAGAHRFASAAAGADVTLRLVPGAYHEPLNEPGGGALIDEIADWILDRAARPPVVVPPPEHAPHHYTWQEGLAFGAAVNIAARMLGTNTGRYQAVKRPWFAPPGWVFPIAWAINSALSISGNLRVLNAPASADRTAYLRLWTATWLLYLSFGFAFFRLKSPLLGLIVTINFAALAVLSAGRALRIDRRLGWTYATLLPWLALAGAVAASVALDNPDPLLDGSGAVDRPPA